MIKKLAKTRTSLILFVSLAILFFLVVFLRKMTVGDIHPKGSPVVRIGANEFGVEIAESEGERQKGLGGRESLCQDCGMIFLFPRKEKASFWMRDMNFNLDIIWISEGEIVEIRRDVSRDSKEIMTPKVSADRVLEINAGTCSRLGIDAGDRVDFENI